MKKIIPVILLFIVSHFVSKAQTFSDDFESYTLIAPVLGIQSPDWRTWSSAIGGGVSDVSVIATDNHTSGGSQSIYFSSTSYTGGPQDVVLPFGASPLNTGQFTYSMWLKIPSGKTSYFEFVGDTLMADALDCYMIGGDISIRSNGTLVLTSTHPVGSWFRLTINANFNTNLWELFINGVSQGTWHNVNNQLYAIDYYPVDSSASFWLDDVSYTIVPYTFPTINAALSLLSINSVSNGLVGQQRNLDVTVRNIGLTTIDSFDITVSQNGGIPIVQHTSGLTLASYDSTIIHITSPFTLLEGVNNFTAIIQNVNGSGPDGDPSDDSCSKTLTPVVPAAGKMVVVEDKTATWCMWSPRSQVYMNIMAKNYNTYYVGIAVHDYDPMVKSNYDAAISSLISSFPNSYIDRTVFDDPVNLEAEILNRVTIVPKAFITNGATYDSSTRQLKVSLSTNIQQAIAGNYKIACVLTEDNVTGSASGYNQQNAYSGGASGTMGGFEILSNPVPANLMHYDNVARMISPNFSGQANAFGTSANVGDLFTHTFTFTLPSTWNDTLINIIGLFIDTTGAVDNASSTTISKAVTNGYVSGIEIGITEIFASDAKVSVYPNPTNSNATVTLNLEKESFVDVAIYSVNGLLIANKDYGKLNGSVMLPIDIRYNDTGMYFIKVTVDGKTTMTKLIKE